jgi:hypothetical protein
MASASSVTLTGVSTRLRLGRRPAGQIELRADAFVFYFAELSSDSAKYAAAQGATELLRSRSSAFGQGDAFLVIGEDLLVQGSLPCRFECLICRVRCADGIADRWIAKKIVA